MIGKPVDLPPNFDVEPPKSPSRLPRALILVFVIVFTILACIVIILALKVLTPVEAGQQVGMLKNNLQASHSYKGSLTGFKIEADAYGNLSGSSMQPTFFSGNTALMRTYHQGDALSEGDLVRFIRAKDCDSIDFNGYATIHRINAIYDDYIIVIGDNFNELEYIRRCQITDVVVGIIFT